MLTPQDSSLLLTIAQAGAEEDGWPVMLRALMGDMQASDARLYPGDLVWGPDGAKTDPLPGALAGLRLRRVYTGEELAERALTPDLPGDRRALGVQGPHGAVWLVLHRASGLFRAADSARVSALVPHLEQALHMAARMEALRSQAVQARRLARRVGVGQVRFGARGEIVAADEVARDLLARANAVSRGEFGPGVVALGAGVELVRHGDEGYLRATDMALPAPEILAQELGLALPEARLARALGQGATLRDAAAMQGVTIETARYYSKQIFAKIGARGQPDLIRRLWTGAVMLA